jgi:hypothetical protein
VFVYIYNLTFFGGCLAVAGYLEKKDLHGLVCMPKKKLEFSCISVRFALVDKKALKSSKDQNERESSALKN